MRTAANVLPPTPAGWLLAAGVSVAAHGALLLQLPGNLAIPHVGEGDGVTLALQVQPTPQAAVAPPQATDDALPARSPLTKRPSDTGATPRRASAVNRSAAAPSDARRARQPGPARTDYLGELQRWLAQHQHYPTAARERGWQGVVELAFSIDRVGRVTGAQVAASSGHPVLDRAALDMLTRAAPLPPVPPHVAQHSLRLRVPISFSLWDTPAP